MSWLFLVVYFYICTLAAEATATAAKKNVIVILADDLGFKDVSYNGGPIPTPNIDGLAANGLILDYYITHPLCTPSRASFLTGKYAHSTGLNGALVGPNPWGLNDTNTIPQMFKDNGYTTHMVGKWHLGHSRERFHPLKKGFDTFFGNYLGGCGYRSKRVGVGLDLHDGYKHVKPDDTHYTDLISQKSVEHLSRKDKFFLFVSYTAPHAPLDPAEEDLKMCEHIAHHGRRYYCGLVVGVDRGVGLIISRLRELQKLNDTIIVFMSDNGGQPWSGARNGYRGTKFSTFEGGSRAPALIYGAGYTGRRNSQFHVSDWLPTFEAYFNFKTDWKVEGMNQIPVLESDKTIRTESVITFDPIFGSYAFQFGKYKFMHGNLGDDHQYEEPGIYFNEWNPLSSMKYVIINTVNIISEAAGDLMDFFMGKDFGLFWREILEVIRTRVQIKLENHDNLRVYDISTDPFENNNIVDAHPEIVQRGMDLIAHLNKTTSPIRWMVYDENGKAQHRTGKDKGFHANWLGESDPDPLEVTEAFEDFATSLRQFVITCVIGFLAFFFFLIYLFRSRYKSRKSSN